MANTPYPLPRQTRESTIQVGNGTAGPYGPSQYRVFDIEDVRVYLQDEGEESFADVTDSCTVTKTAGDGYDTFSVTFAAAVPATSRWYHAAKRVSNRSVAVTRAGTLVSDELEKELSKQASALSEMRRDIGRALKVDPDQDEVWVQPLADGHISVWRDGQMVDGGSVDAIHESADSAAASAAAAAISAGNAADSAGAAAGSADAAASAAISAIGSADAAAADRALAVAAANSASNSAGAAANDRAAVAIDRAAVADDRDAAAASAGAAAGSANSAANSAGAAADDRAAVAIDRAAVADDRNAAAGSAGAASASAGAAAGSAAKADEWANAPENQPVEPGKFSAFHWSKKAEEAAGGSDPNKANLIGGNQFAGNQRIDGNLYVGPLSGAPVTPVQFDGKVALGNSVSGDRVNSGTPGSTGRALSLIDTAAVIRVWRRQTGGNSATVELAVGDGSDNIADASIRRWDFGITYNTNRFEFRYLTGTTQVAMSIQYDMRIGIGTQTPHSSAHLEVASTTRGFLPPRMTTEQRDAIASPAAGLLVWDTTISKLMIFDGSGWLTQAAGSYVPTTRSIATQHSIQGGGNLSANRTLSLVGDTASPGINKVYGTDGTGERGWIEMSSIGTKFTDVSGSRVRNTVYQNTTGRWLIVYAGSPNNGNSVEISADGTTWYEVTRGGQSYSQAVFVPPGWRYRANPSSGTLMWLETVD